MRDAVATVLLAAGVALELLACAGVLLMRTALDRLHYVGAGAPGALLIAAAILVRESFSQIGDKAVLVAVLLLVGSPVLTHATARVLHAEERG